LQNSPLESSSVVIALIENYSTSKPLKVSPEKSQILNCDSVVVTVLSQMSESNAFTGVPKATCTVQLHSVIQQLVKMVITE